VLFLLITHKALLRPAEVQPRILLRQRTGWLVSQHDAILCAVWKLVRNLLPAPVQRRLSISYRSARNTGNQPVSFARPKLGQTGGGCGLNSNEVAGKYDRGPCRDAIRTGRGERKPFQGTVGTLVRKAGHPCSRL
jgi:hypothetical protein